MDKISLFTRVRLWFQPMKVSLDLAPPGKDKSVKTYFKVLDGKTYLIKQEIFEQEPGLRGVSIGTAIIDDPLKGELP